MRNKVAIVGCGFVGMSYAFSLLNTYNKLDELVLIDINKEKVEGNLLDISQAAINCNSSVKIINGNYSDCSDASIVCITAGTSQSEIKESRTESFKTNDNIMKSIVTEVKNSGFSGIYLIASNPLDVMCYSAWQYAKTSPNKILGSGTFLETARLKYFLSKKLNIPAKNITGYVFGEHGDSQFVVWSSVKIFDEKTHEYNSIDIYLNETEKEEIENLVKHAGYEILKRTGATHYGVSNCLTKLTTCILSGEESYFPVSNYDKEKHIYISSLARVGRDGIVSSLPILLTRKEKDMYNKSAEYIKSFIDQLDFSDSTK